MEIINQISNAERELVVKAKRSKQLNLVLGDTWCLLDPIWYRRWLDCTSNNMVSSAVPPGEIDNTRMVDNATGDLAKNLCEDMDYTLIPSSIYDSLVEIYGGGPRIVRQVVSYNKASTMGVIDIYPLKYNIFVANDTCSEEDLPASPAMTFYNSKYSDFDTIKKTVAAGLQMSEKDSYRLWARDPKYFDSRSDIHVSESKSAVSNDGVKYVQHIADSLPGSWVYLPEEVIYAVDYPKGVIDLLVEKCSSTTATYDSSDHDKKKLQGSMNDFRGGLLNLWMKKLKPGDELDACDDESNWFESIVVDDPKIAPGSVKIHFKGWSSKWDLEFKPQQFGFRLAPLYSKVGNWRELLKVINISDKIK